MKRQLTRLGLMIAALGALILIGGRAAAHHGAKGLERRITARVDEALGAARVTQPQRMAIYAARDHVVSVFQEEHAARKGIFEQALSLFEADKLDSATIDAERARNEHSMGEIGNAVAQALYDVHDTLTGEQRQAVAEYVRSIRPKKAGITANLQARMIKKVIQMQIDSALDAAYATPAQRQPPTRLRSE